MEMVFICLFLKFVANPQNHHTMLEKGFLRDSTRSEPRHKRNRTTSMVSTTMLYLGVIILIASLIYMIVNINRAEAILGIWIIFMMAGLFLVVVSHLVKWIFR